jgi:hypothetical protein
MVAVSLHLHFGTGRSAPAPSSYGNSILCSYPQFCELSSAVCPTPTLGGQLLISLYPCSGRSTQHFTLSQPAQDELCSLVMVTSFVLWGREGANLPTVCTPMWFPRGWMICGTHLVGLQIYSSGFGSWPAECR